MPIHGYAQSASCLKLIHCELCRLLFIRCCGNVQLLSKLTTEHNSMDMMSDVHPKSDEQTFTGSDVQRVLASLQHTYWFRDFSLSICIEHIFRSASCACLDASATPSTSTDVHASWRLLPIKSPHPMNSISGSLCWELFILAVHALNCHADVGHTLHDVAGSSFPRQHGSIAVTCLFISVVVHRLVLDRAVRIWGRWIWKSKSKNANSHRVTASNSWQEYSTAALLSDASPTLSRWKTSECWHYGWHHEQSKTCTVESTQYELSFRPFCWYSA